MYAYAHRYMCTCVYIYFLHNACGAPTSTAVLTLLTMLTTTFSLQVSVDNRYQKTFRSFKRLTTKGCTLAGMQMPVPIRTATTPTSCAHATASASTHGHTEAHAHQPRAVQPHELIVATGALRVIFRWHRWHAASLCRKCVVRRRRATHCRSQHNRCRSARHRYATIAVLLLMCPRARRRSCCFTCCNLH